MSGTTNNAKSGTFDDGAYDVVVVGAGAAGLSAALVLARARRRVAVVDAGGPRNAPAAHMHGFLSRDGMSPADLLAVGRAEVAGYGVGLFESHVDQIDPGFSVRLDGGAVLGARRVVVATGLWDELPAIPGARERWGKDLLFCPYCHAYEVRDQPIGVLGTHPGAVRHALLLRQWSHDVVFFAHTLDLGAEEREQLAARGIVVAEGTVKRPVTDGDRLRGVELVEGHVVPRSAVFVFQHMVPHDTLLTGLGVRAGPQRLGDHRRCGPDQRVRGVGGRQRVRCEGARNHRCGAGAAAASALNRDLVAEDVERAVKDGSSSSREPQHLPRPVPRTASSG
ncbi:FAD-dependent oxidoreductase (plasmid) [Streptomyces sp. NBC_01005]|nr:FAD-dependent oxidoreductase [Streptomyces sp. NBC_01005]WTD00840.1 FAD-dependent oxidoreductase [Streptomyces sp. NBC_01650]